MRSAWIEDRAGRGGMRWRARYRGVDGRKHSKTFVRKPDAQRWLDQQVAALGRGEWVDPNHGRTEFADWASKVMGSRVHLAETTRNRDETYLRTMVLPHLGSLPLSSIQPSDLRTMVASLTADGKAPATVRKAYQIAGLVLRQAVSDGLIVRSPARGIDLPSDRDRPEMRFLSVPEVATLTEAMTPRYQGMVLMAAYGGLRLGEVGGLGIADFDLLRRTVTIRRNLVELDSGRLVLGPTKTKASRRTVTLPRLVTDHLAQHLAVFGTGPDGVVFTSPEGGLVRYASWRRRYWQPAVTEAGLEPLRFHDLRHTHAALLIAQGEHPKVIQSRLGHTSISTTLDTYGHLMEGLDAGVAERLDEMALPRGLIRKA